jgi:hypothetical protein
MPLKEFEDAVKSNTDWWNSKQGTTCELSMGYDNIQGKMEILAKYSETLNDGNWAVHHCDTCKEHSSGEANLHAMIWPTKY